MKLDEISRLQEIGSAGPGKPGGPATGPGRAGETSFGDLLNDSLREVNSLQNEADQAIKELATGGKSSLHETMIAIERADLSFRLMMQVRNKIVEAYQEIMRMTV